MSAGFMVCDPSVDPDEWTPTPDATNSRDAAREFLIIAEYDESDFDTGSPFKLNVRSEGGHEETVRVRVVPMHFEVS